MQLSKEKIQFGIGIDIGGTKVSIVLGTQDGKILEKKIIPTPHDSQAKLAFKLIRIEVDEILSKRKLKISQIKGIGVGLPGLFNHKTGVLEESPNLRDWVGLDLIKSISKAFPRPIRIENDANATAVAEKLYGSGRGHETFVYITVSTGIGAGIVVNNKLHHGISGCAGEAGQSIVNPVGWRNHLGIPGTLEGEASGTAIARKGEKVYKNSKILTRLRKRDGEIKPQHLKEAMLKGDKIAEKVLEESAEKLGIGLSNLIMILNPEKIILGGGVLKGKGGEIFFNMAKQSAKKYAWPRPYKACEIIKTKSLEKIADLGALSLVFEE